MTATKRPNIVFILTDDQRFDTLGCMGNKEIITPNIDQLGEKGVIFDNHYDTTAICMASRSTIFTGLYEYKHGCNFCKGSLGKDKFLKSYPVLLRDSGYLTGFIGKFGVPVTDSQGSITEVENFVECEYGYQDFLKQKEEKYRPHNYFDSFVLVEGGRYSTAARESIKKYASEYPHQTRALGAAAKDFIREYAKLDQPFYLSVNPQAPHEPLIADPEYADLYKGVRFTPPSNWGPNGAKHLPEQAVKSRAYMCGSWWYPDEVYQKNINIYYRQIYDIDVMVGMIHEELENQGIAKDTIIIYSSDNGYFCGSHNMGQKDLLYEEGARAPLIIYDPRDSEKNRGVRCNALTGNIDLAPTILDIAGIKVPDHMDGKSLLPLLNNPCDHDFRDELLLTQFFPGTIEGLSLSVVTPNWKYIYWFYGNADMEPSEELYNMKTDRLEMVNEAANPLLRAELDKMRGFYDSHVKDMQEHCWKGSFYPLFVKMADRNIHWSEKNYGSTLVQPGVRYSDNADIKSSGLFRFMGELNIGDGMFTINAHNIKNADQELIWRSVKGDKNILIKPEEEVQIVGAEFLGYERILIDGEISGFSYGSMPIAYHNRVGNVNQKIPGGFRVDGNVDKWRDMTRIVLDEPEQVILGHAIPGNENAPVLWLASDEKGMAVAIAVRKELSGWLQDKDLLDYVETTIDDIRLYIRALPGQVNWMDPSLQVGDAVIVPKQNSVTMEKEIRVNAKKASVDASQIEFEIKSFTSGNGYQAEIYIPWSALKVLDCSPKAMGFNLLLNTSEDGTRASRRYVWSEPASKYYLVDTRHWGILFFK